MTVQREVGLQFALVKEILDPKAQKQQVEEKIRAVEERNSLLLQNAARMQVWPGSTNRGAPEVSDIGLS